VINNSKKRKASEITGANETLNLADKKVRKIDAFFAKKA
jgi:hypothetical protein